MRRFLRRAVIALTFCSFAFTSCSPGQVRITGTIKKNGEPMIVSEDTYVTLSFIPELSDQSDDKRSSYSAKFDQKSGTYSVELPPGKYRTMLVIALPPKKQGELNMPGPPFKPDTVHDLSKNQQLDIDIPGK
jgi:hypothetical protein